MDLHEINLRDWAKHYEIFHKMKPDSMRKLRNELGMNQTKFAKMWGYTNKTHISLYETGGRKIPKYIAFLCNLLQYKNNE